MKTEEFFFKSKDDMAIHVYKWMPVLYFSWIHKEIKQK